jgi:hypothetical protein
MYRSQPTDAWREAWSLTESLVLEVGRLAGEAGARLAVVLVPAPWEVYPEVWEDVLTRVSGTRAAGLDVEYANRRLEAFLVKGHIPHINLLPEFRVRRQEGAPLYFSGDHHWTAAGHRLAADLLREPLARMLRAN